MKIAIHPWELELTDAGSSTLTDTVVSIRHDRGRLLIRLTRFTVQASQQNAARAIVEGTTVGLRVAPGDVRILAANH